MSDGESDEVMEVLSGVSAFTGEPFVQLRWGIQMAQFTPEEARQYALNVLAVAEASESDAAVVKMLTDDIGLPEQAALQFLVALRDRRA